VDLLERATLGVARGEDDADEAGRRIEAEHDDRERLEPRLGGVRHVEAEDAEPVRTIAKVNPCAARVLVDQLSVRWVMFMRAVRPSSRAARPRSNWLVRAASVIGGPAGSPVWAFSA